jgi:hypothetical protein
MWRIYWTPNSIPIYIQQDATLHSLFISVNCSTCFGWYFHLSSGAHTTVSTASGICHTVTAICRYRGRVGRGLSVLWVAYATHSTLKPGYIYIYSLMCQRKVLATKCGKILPWSFYRYFGDKCSRSETDRAPLFSSHSKWNILVFTRMG